MNVIQAMEGVLTHLKDNGEGIIEDLGTGLTQALDVLGVNFSETLRDSVSNVKTGVDTAGSIIKNGAEKVWDQLSEQRKLIMVIVQEFAKLITTMIDQVNGVAVGVSEKITSVAEGLSGIVTKLNSEISTVVHSIQNGVMSNVNSLYKNTQDIFTVVVSSIGNLEPVLRNTIIEITRSVNIVIDEIMSGIVDTSNALHELISTAMTSLHSFMVQVDNDIDIIFNSLDSRTDQLRSKTVSVIKEVQTDVDSLMDSLSLSNLFKSITIIVIAAGVCIVAFSLLIRVMKRRNINAT